MQQVTTTISKNALPIGSPVWFVKEGLTQYGTVVSHSESGDMVEVHLDIDLPGMHRYKHMSSVDSKELHYSNHQQRYTVMDEMHIMRATQKRSLTDMTDDDLETKYSFDQIRGMAIAYRRQNPLRTEPRCGHCGSSHIYFGCNEATWNTETNDFELVRNVETANATCSSCEAKCMNIRWAVLPPTND